MNGQMPLAQIYIEEQQFTAPFSPEEGLEKGTAWAQLYQPYGGDGQ